MKRMAVLLLVLILFAFAWSFYLSSRMGGSSPLGSREGHPITARQYQRMLGVGINVDWMTFLWVNHYYFYWRSRGANVPGYFKKEGFSNVRIRVSQDVAENRTLLVQLGEIVNDTLKAGLIPIITYTAPELRENPTSRKAQEHFVEWWLTIAHYFKGYPYTLSYDLLIESSGNIKNHPEILNKIYSQTIAEIRAIDPYRIVFVTPAGISSPFHLNELNVTNDGYTLAEWHIYAGGPRGCSYNESYIKASIQAALNWSKATGIPTWLGAWRPNVYPKISGKNGCQFLCPLEVELNFSRTMVSALSEAGIPYDINADTRFFDIENLTWYDCQKNILEVIVHPSSST